MFILDDLLIWLPVKGLVGILKTIAEVAESEVSNESRIKEDLLLLQTLYEIDEITEEEYQKREDELLERLTMIREAESD
jgi:hypothetical protein